MRFSIVLLLILINCTTKTSETSMVDDTQSGDTLVTEEMDEANSRLAENNEDVNDCACDVSAYLDDPDASGTNIRETPNGKIIGQLKYEEDCGCLVVRFVESKNGWMKLYDGGWVYGKLFSVDTRNYGQDQKVFLNEYPTEESDVVAEFDREKHFSVKGCCGTWLLVDDGMGNTGWLIDDMVCANPLTNCS